MFLINLWKSLWDSASQHKDAGALGILILLMGTVGYYYVNAKHSEAALLIQANKEKTVDFAASVQKNMDDKHAAIVSSLEDIKTQLKILDQRIWDSRNPRNKWRKKDENVSYKF